MTAAVPEPRDLTADEAEECIAGIRAAVNTGWQWIAKAVNGRAWIALGYASWDAMCEDRLAGVRLALPRAERQEAVAELRQAGMSTRAIASGLGVDARTVRRDMESTGASAPVAQPTTVTSLDGRQRPATQPPRETVVVDTATGEIVGKVRAAMDEHVSDADLALASWRKHFGRAVGDVIKPLSFPVDQVAAKADRALLDELERAHRDLGNYIERVKKATRIRPIGGAK